MSEFKFRHCFRGTSDQGLTYFWLKATFGAQIHFAVGEAITALYYPQCLAADLIATAEQVRSALQESSTVFERWMSLPRETLPKTTVTRFRVAFTLPMDESKTGRCLSWLDKRGDRVLNQSVIDAVLLMYLPLALAANRSSRVELERLRSRTVFSQALDLPGCSIALPEWGSVGANIVLTAGQADAVEAVRPLVESLPVAADMNGLGPDADLEVDLDFDF